MKAITTYLFGQYHAQREALWLRRLLYIFLLIKCAGWLFQSELLFGPESMVTVRPLGLPALKAAAFWLFNGNSLIMARFVLISCILLSVYGLVAKRFGRAVAVLIWFLLCNINNAIYPTLTGGDFLFQQLLFFNIFLAPYETGAGPWREFSQAFHNAGVMALRIQVCIVYLLSALAKLGDADWLSGDALFQTLSVRDFSLPFIYSDLSHNTWFLSLSTYVTLIYQLLFPVLIWFRKIKRPLLAFGIFQHLFIAVVIGLPSFGFIMIISYSIFYVPSRKAGNSF